MRNDGILKVDFVSTELVAAPIATEVGSGMLSKSGIGMGEFCRRYTDAKPMVAGGVDAPLVQGSCSMGSLRVVIPLKCI